jgi:nitrite reductase/ring-hydroxylating ferredoxin subunit
MDLAGAWRADATTIAPGQSAVFRLARGDRTISAFLVNYRGAYYAWVNRCPHAGTPLDAWPNEFFSEDGRHLVCSTHGAVFDPATGVCVEGPCPGARLEPLAVARAGDDLVVACP